MEMEAIKVEKFFDARDMSEDQFVDLVRGWARDGNMAWEGDFIDCSDTLKDVAVKEYVLHVIGDARLEELFPEALIGREKAMIALLYSDPAQFGYEFAKAANVYSAQLFKDGITDRATRMGVCVASELFWHPEDIKKLWIWCSSQQDLVEIGKAYAEKLYSEFEVEIRKLLDD